MAQPGFPAGYLLFGPRLLTAEPDLGRRVLVAYLKGAGAYRRDTADPAGREAVAQMLRGLQINASAGMASLGFPDDARPSLHFVEDFMAWLTTSGVVRKPPRLADILDDRLRVQALAELGGRL